MTMTWCTVQLRYNKLPACLILNNKKILLSLNWSPIGDLKGQVLRWIRICDTWRAPMLPRSLPQCLCFLALENKAGHHLSSSSSRCVGKLVRSPQICADSNHFHLLSQQAPLHQPVQSPSAPTWNYSSHLTREKREMKTTATKETGSAAADERCRGTRTESVQNGGPGPPGFWRSTLVLPRQIIHPLSHRNSKKAGKCHHCPLQRH
jgi:hypothetical protein